MEASLAANVSLLQHQELGTVLVAAVPALSDDVCESYDPFDDVCESYDASDDVCESYDASNDVCELVFRDATNPKGESL